jgi:hypothetical protein
MCVPYTHNCRHGLYAHQQSVERCVNSPQVLVGLTGLHRACTQHDISKPLQLTQTHHAALSSGSKRCANHCLACGVDVGIRQNDGVVLGAHVGLHPLASCACTAAYVLARSVGADESHSLQSL